MSRGLAAGAPDERADRRHRDDPEFGDRFLRDEAADVGWSMNRRTAWSLSSRGGLVSVTQRRKRGKGARPRPPVFDDRVQREFIADQPNRLWLTDITEHRTTSPNRRCTNSNTRPVAKQPC